MALRHWTLILLIALAGCQPVSSNLTDEQLAVALERAIRINHIYEGKPGAADSVGTAWREWMEKEGITRQAMEQALDARKSDPERWYPLVSLLESRRDSLFPTAIQSPAVK